VARALARADGFVSGEQLARAAGVSRVAVQAYVRRLVEAGATVEARPGSGYRMVAPPSRPDGLGVAVYGGASGAARARWLGEPTEHHAQLASTNDRAIEAARRGDHEGLVVVTDLQTAGRGRRGRAWLSPEGGLYLSMLLRPPLEARRLALVGITVALGVARGLEALGIEGAALKWPNDVVVARRKVAGVLVEASVDVERVAWAVAGVGIDAGEAPPDLAAQAVGIAELLGPADAPSRAAVLSAVLDWTEPELERLYAGDPALLADASARCETLGSEVAVTLPDGSTVQGSATALDHDGCLVLLTASGEVRLASGDVAALRGR
jgi:BirA family biotin operon repressor/biotin-[acetyl-CoA-carboxylase] ligase